MVSILVLRALLDDHRFGVEEAVDPTNRDAVERDNALAGDLIHRDADADRVLLGKAAAQVDRRGPRVRPAGVRRAGLECAIDRFL